ncbi:MAG: phospholipase D family protein [Azospirillum brasilense]|nr:MAG: phospholipase D family protein [Azospirillum brasilense]
METAKTLLRRPHRRLLPRWRSARPTLDQAVDEALRRIGADTGTTLVANGLEAFGLRAASARAATRSLDLQYYAWHDGITGRLLAREILHAADRGVSVRLLLDDSCVLDDQSAAPLLCRLGADHPGIEVRIFNAHRWRFLGKFGFGLELLLSRGQLNHRMHNKSWIADGRLAILGGRNIGDEYFDASGSFNFRDLDIAVAGGASQQALAQFERYWNHRLARRGQCCDTPESLDALRRRLDADARSAEAQPYLERVRASLERDILHGYASLLPTQDVEVAADPPDKATGEEVPGRLVTAIDAALRGTEREALLISPYFVPGEAGAEALTGMLRRGVRVRVITNSLAATDVVAVHGGYSRYRRRLLKEGLEIYELKRSGREDAGVLGSKGASLHTKAFVLDREQLFVGSFNLDPRSANLNTEMGAFVRNADLAERLRREFRRLSSPQRSYHLGLRRGLMVWIDERPDGRRRVQHKEPDASWRRRLLAQLVRWLPVESQL